MFQMASYGQNIVPLRKDIISRLRRYVGYWNNTLEKAIFP
jgi:hypothetical protein